MSEQPRKLDHLEKMIGEDPAVNGGARDYDMRIARDGTWFHEGSPIRRKALVKLFSTVLRRDETGDFWLVTPVERGRIEVEDAPFTAVEMIVSGQGKGQILSFLTNLDDMVRVDADHPIRVAENEATGEPFPYVTVRGNLEALIVRAVFYELVDLAEEQWDGDEAMLGVWSDGVLFPLGATE